MNCIEQIDCKVQSKKNLHHCHNLQHWAIFMYNPVFWSILSFRRTNNSMCLHAAMTVQTKGGISIIFSFLCRLYAVPFAPKTPSKSQLQEAFYAALVWERHWVLPNMWCIYYMFPAKFLVFDEILIQVMLEGNFLPRQLARFEFFPCPPSTLLKTRDMEFNNIANEKFSIYIMCKIKTKYNKFPSAQSSLIQILFPTDDKAVLLAGCSILVAASIGTV